MPTTYTESKCDACPRACRAGVFIYNGGLLSGRRTPTSCPCLLEITGPADRLPCVLGIEDRPGWHRVTN